MDEKSPDELLGGEGHCVVSLVPVVLPAETHTTIFDIKQAVVGDGDTVSVSPQVIEHLLRPRERLFCVDDPFGFPDRRQVTLELVSMLKSLDR